MSFLSLLPLRSTAEDAVDFSELKRLGCDVDRLHRLRDTCASCFRDHDNSDSNQCYEQALSQIDTIQEYAAALSECTQFTPNGSNLTFNWKWSKNSNNHHHFGSSSDSSIVYFGGLRWERQNVILNLCVLQVYEASKAAASSTSASTPSMMKQVVSRLQSAATLANHLSQLCDEDTVDDDGRKDLSKSYFVWLENYLLGEAQRFSYTTMASTFRLPKHYLLAKVAAACIPLYQAAAHADHTTSRTGGDVRHDVVRAWGMYFDAVSEFHQALAHAEKKEPSACVTRLTAALRFASLCHDFCGDCNADNDIVYTECSRLTVTLMQSIEDRLAACEQQQGQSNDEIVDRDELAEIEPKRTVELTPQKLPVLLPPLPPPALFALVTKTSDAVSSDELQNTAFKRTIDSVADCQEEAQSEQHQEVEYLNYQQWKQQCQRNIDILAEWVQEQTDAARHALSLVNLPHSLTAYRQQASGGGIPMDLWKRVEQVQQTQKDERLKSQLWHLRDDSEKALRIYHDIQAQLEEDLQRDRVFRSQHADFRGHNVQQVQVHFRQALDNYSRLMGAAQESDRVLAEQLQILETDPKFRLLKFQKKQLDHLLPTSVSSSSDPGHDLIDVSELSRCLVNLSERLEQRDAQLAALQDFMLDAATRLDALAASSRSVLDPEMHRFIQDATRHIEGESHIIQNSVADQKELLRRILQLNEEFMSAREETSATESSSNILIKLDDALEELDEFNSHLKEGTAFYNVIIPKLEKLKHNVGDVSTRLEVERCEYEEKVQRARQEEADKMFAENLADANARGNNNINSNNNTSAVTSTRPTGNTSTTPPPPGVEQVSHTDGPAVRVDDEKVASLIAMDFDPERVVEALRKYDNDVEQALNELLGG